MAETTKPAAPAAGQAPDAAPPRIISGSDQAANEAVPQEQRTASAGQAPPPPPPGQALGQRQEAGQPEDLSARAADLERQLAEVRTRASGAGTVRLRVDPDGPHSHIVFNGMTVSQDWTEVPEHVVPEIMEGAANSGVTLTQEETES